MAVTAPSMRLLLDENLSESVAVRIRDCFTDVSHVRSVLGGGASDRDVWSLARRERRALVTLDADFVALSLTLGAPPKVIWIDAHNPSNAGLAALLLARAASIRAFLGQDEATMLVLTLPRAEGGQRKR